MTIQKSKQTSHKLVLSIRRLKTFGIESGATMNHTAYLQYKLFPPILLQQGFEFLRRSIYR